MVVYEFNFRKIEVRKNYQHLGLYLFANLAEHQAIYINYTAKIFPKDKKVSSHLMSRSNAFENKNGDWDNFGWHKFFDWKTMEDHYLDCGKLEMEVHVIINEMFGFPREELRNFWM
ncbi:hypothetical protein B9Z55_007476 [Caenorhabditis nigoni]|uniref:MATH domain-containing protein n=1 Tax=Caenorhabditis nigoni TaxID=1611254 RepID=A0A2G5VAG7_9PELO|nr:hypothetical protein B9Z55_007476 [Caenorhabditis nigoni]